MSNRVNLKESLSVDALAEKFDLIRQKLESGECDLKPSSSSETESITIDLDKIDEIVVVPGDQILTAGEKAKEEEPYLFACKYLLPDVRQVSASEVKFCQ